MGLPNKKGSERESFSSIVVYYESIKREVKTKLIYECRYDERLKTKAEESTRLTSLSKQTRKLLFIINL